MKLLVLTSKDHIYANYLLKKLFESGVFAGHEVTIWEQGAIVPGKSKLSGLLRYIQISGIWYVSVQIAKQLLFVFLRWICVMGGNRKSIFYPYWMGVKNLDRHEVNGIKRPEVLKDVEKLRPDVLLSLFSKEIIPKSLLAIPTFTPVNLHPAPLPAFRGVSPIFWAMATDTAEIGVTLHYLDAGIDTGKIVSQKKTTLIKGETEHGAYLRLVDLGLVLVLGYMRSILKRKRVLSASVPRKMKHSYFSLPTKEAVGALYRNGYGMVRLSEMIGR